MRRSCTDVRSRYSLSTLSVQSLYCSHCTTVTVLQSLYCSVLRRGPLWCGAAQWGALGCTAAHGDEVWRRALHCAAWLCTAHRCFLWVQCGAGAAWAPNRAWKAQGMTVGALPLCYAFPIRQPQDFLSLSRRPPASLSPISLQGSPPGG